MNRDTVIQYQVSSGIKSAGVHPKNNFDVLRLSGALMVLFSHSWGMLGKGVDQPATFITGSRIFASDIGLFIFFTISGFLVLKSFQRSTFFTYIIKRLLRIAPALIIANLFCVLLGALVSDLPAGTYFASSQTWKFLFINSTLIINEFHLPGVFSGNPFHTVNSSLWTIPFEFKLYILLALAGVAGLFKTRKVIIVLFCLWCLVSLLIENKLLDLGHLSKYFGLGLYFFSGMMMAVFEKYIPFKWQYALLLLFIAIILRGTFLHPLTGFLLLSYSCITFGRSRQVISLRNIDISYGTYLYAYPIQQTVIWVYGSQINPYIHIILSTIVTVTLALLSWKFIEKPALSQKKTMI